MRAARRNRRVTLPIFWLGSLPLGWGVGEPIIQPAADLVATAGQIGFLLGNLRSVGVPVAIVDICFSGAQPEVSPPVLVEEELELPQYFVDGVPGEENII